MRLLPCVILLLAIAGPPVAGPPRPGQSPPPGLADIFAKPNTTPAGFRISRIFWDCRDGGFVVECRLSPPSGPTEHYVTARVGQRVYDTDWIVDRVARFDRPHAGIGLVLVMRRENPDNTTDWFSYQFTGCTMPPRTFTVPPEGPITEPRTPLPNEPGPPSYPGRPH